MITADQLKDVMDRADALHHYLNIDQKKVEFEEEQLRTQAPDFWEDPKYAQEQMKKVKGIQKWLDGYKTVRLYADELQLAFDFYKDEMVTEEEVDADYAKAIKAIEDLELKNMLRQKEDPMDCVLKINSGAGGTESQDWAQMLMRMYIRWAEKHGYGVEVYDTSYAEEAGIKSATFTVKEPYAYGLLSVEQGTHRLVRISPFDNQGRRQTSFAGVEVLPIVEQTDHIEIPDDELRVDVYRSSGKGGQGVNTTDSAVRITHLPSGIVVECQDERSQHKNRARAMSWLSARLNDMQTSAAQNAIASERKLLVGSGDRSERIRTYNFPQGRVTDHRINLTLYRLDQVLAGMLDDVILPVITHHQSETLKSAS